MSHKSRNGFALITAIALAGFVGVALAVVLMSFSAELKRTRSASDEAQLRQLLLAGASDAAARARGWPEAAEPHRWEVTLPDDLARLGAKVTSESQPSEAGLIQVRVNASLGGRRAAQTLRLAHTDKGWQTVAARIDD